MDLGSGLLGGRKHNMSHRTSTYVAFHAEGKKNPIETDMKYYQLLKAWNVRDDNDFRFVDSHEKTAALRDWSARETVMRRLKERLSGSKNMILIIGETTRLDTDWVPFEIQYAVDSCEIPIIAAYPTSTFYIMAPGDLESLWPMALTTRIANNSAHVIHVPFRQEPLRDAVGQFSQNQYPKNGGLGCYGREAYQQWGFLHLPGFRSANSRDLKEKPERRVALRGFKPAPMVGNK
jgi:hypothetical protein